MPLNAAQESLIAQTLEDYLEEFADETQTPAALTAFLQKMTRAIDDSGEEQLDDCTIYNCLRQPGSYFLRLNDNGSDIATITEVKTHILRLLDPYLQKKALTLAVDISSLWNLQTAIATIPAHLNQKALTHTPPRTESDESGIANEEIGEIFSFTITQEEEPSNFLIANVTTRIPGSVIETTVRLVEIVHAPGSWEDDDQFIQEQIPTARTKAMIIATKHAVDYLRQKKLMTDAEAKPFAPKRKRGNNEESLSIATHALQLFLHPYYYARLCDGSLPASIIGFSKSRAKTLLSAPVLSLLEANALPAASVYQLCKLTPFQRKLLGQHHLAIANHSFELDLLLSMNEKQCAIFSDQKMIELLRTKKISYQEASLLKTHHIAMISHFHDMIQKCKEPIAWQALLKLQTTTCQCLMSDDMRHFIRTEKLSLNDIFEHLEEKLSKVFGARLAKAYLAGKGSYTALCQLKEAEQTGSRYLSLIERHAFLESWLAEELCTIDDIASSEAALIESTSKIYANRLLSSHHAKTINPASPACDIVKLQNEWRIIAAQHEMPMQTLVEKVIGSFLILMKDEMAEHADHKKNEKLRLFCAECIDLINHAEQMSREPTRNGIWHHTLNTIIQLSSERLNSKPTQATSSKNALVQVGLFLNYKSSRDQLSVTCSDFCLSLQQFSALLPEMATAQLVRRM